MSIYIYTFYVSRKKIHWFQITKRQKAGDNVLACIYLSAFARLLAKYLMNCCVDFNETHKKYLLDVYLQIINFGGKLIQDGCHSRSIFSNTKYAATQSDLEKAI